MFVDRFVTKCGEVERVTIDGPAAWKRARRMALHKGRGRAAVGGCNHAFARHARQKSEYISPFRFAFCEMPKRRRHAMPTAEATLERTWVVFPRKEIGAPGEQSSRAADGFAPILEQFGVASGKQGTLWPKSRRPHGFIPFRKIPEEVMRGELHASEELLKRGSAAELFCGRGQGIQNVLLGGHQL